MCWSAIIKRTGRNRGGGNGGSGRALRWAALAAVALFVGPLALWFTAVQWHPSTQRYPRQGIDVSHHQGAIRWAALPRTVGFAYIKASEGGDHRDARFAENWTGARTAGIAHGAYHFFTLCRPGAEQATNFMAAVPRDPGMLPPAVALEFGGNCAARPTPEALVRELRAFLSRTDAHFGQPTILHLTREFDAGYGISRRFARHPLWLRSLFIEPDWGARPWTMWQASSVRRIPGIAGPVDWNVLRP